SVEGLNAMLKSGSWFIRNNPLIQKKWYPDVNLLKEDVGTVSVWVKLHGVHVIAFSEDGLSVISTKIGTPLMPESYTSDMCMQSWGRSSYGRAMIELQANVELKDNIVAAMPKINRKATILVTFVLSMSGNLLDVPVVRSSYGRAMIELRANVELNDNIVVFGHVQEECPKNIDTGETMYMKKTSQIPKGFSVGQKMGFKPKQVYQPVSKKTITNTSANKKKIVDPSEEVTNPFEVLTSVKNDDKLDTNGGASNLASKANNSSGSSFWNAKSSSPSTTLIIKKINKMENLIIDGKAILVDNEGKPLGKVDEDSEDECPLVKKFCLEIQFVLSDGEVSDKSYVEGLNAMLKSGSWFIRNNPLIQKKWYPDVNLLKEDVGTVSVWVKLHGVHVIAFSEDGLSVISTKIGTPLMPDSYTSDMCMQSWGRSSYGRAMIELQANVELKDNIVAVMPKINRKATILVTFVLSMSGNLLDVPVTTANTNVNKKKNVDPPIEVTNPFEVLTSVENDDELDTNGGASNLASKAINSSGSSFWNAESSSPSTTLIIEKINKMENLIIDRKAILVDNKGKPLGKADEDSEDEVASDDNEMASFLAKRDGYGTQSFLEQ
nr:hypothetical protein [Tanacetum cinerariifolium]